MGKIFKQVDDTERRLIKSMLKEQVPWAKVQKITGRSPDTIRSVSASKATKPKAAKGAPVKFSKQDASALYKVIEAMVKKANAQKEVTMDMVLKKAGYDVTARTAREKLKTLCVSFFKLKEKPLLEKGDTKERKRWTDKKKRRSKRQWVKKPHGIIDNKSFPLSVNARGRDLAARRNCRGAYQKKGGQPKKWLVKPKACYKAKFGSIQVTAAVIKGKIRMWHYVEKKWSAKAAAHMYTNVLAKALKKAYPKRKSPYIVIEDNDPTGYQSKAGIAAKKEANIVADSLPKRSPDLNVLDYSLWSQINRRMRDQEARFPKNKKETIDEFKKRLRKTALNLPTSAVKTAVGSMKRRCETISKLKGGLFNE